mmetsp:Transcript_117691/g.204907  ORF Transcript_117691/g.204907 Transcript_117691/m.204907 type:complete len:184 (-) Transcript_117691:20-571(-)
MQVMAKQGNRSGCTGTLEYCAPELLVEDGEGQYVHHHDFHTDMWGLGMIVYFMCYMQLPFKETGDSANTVQQILELGKKAVDLPKVPLYSMELTNLTSMALSPHPGARALPSQILRNHFVRKTWHQLNDDLVSESYGSRMATAATSPSPIASDGQPPDPAGPWALSPVRRQIEGPSTLTPLVL